MTMDRRAMLGAGMGVGIGAAAGLTALSGSVAGRRRSASQVDMAASAGIRASDLNLHANSGNEVSVAFQRAVDIAAKAQQPLLLSPGIYEIADIKLRSTSQLIGIAGASVLRFAGGATFLSAIRQHNVRLQSLVLDGAKEPLDPAQADGLLMAYNCSDLVLRDLAVRNSLLHGISLRQASGRITDCTISHVGQTGLRSVDGASPGVEIMHNVISQCANNGIQIWRSRLGQDGTMVSSNRISHIKAQSGGTGQNGNGINIFRAGSVQLANNHITDCAYSAIRGNAASNIQIIGNRAQRVGEVALYAEFGFEGALIANNLIDQAASGIAVTNFSNGGRLAIVQGNLIRNLVRREFEPHDKRGNGIAVEADAVVTGNVIEAAATSGIMIGWGKYLRDVTVTSNLIRDAKLGIGISSSPQAGACLVAQNMISGSMSGAIRAMEYGRAVGRELVRHNGAGDTSGTGLSARIQLSGNVGPEKS